jgi:predicted metal-dependent enzyme (double-stranded beta helix superfamily)
VFDLDEFITRCRGAATDADPCGAVREAVAEALSRSSAVLDALTPTRAELALLYAGPDITIAKVVWGRGMAFPPHNHLTWACTGIYSGCEVNRLYRLADGGLVESGRFELDEGQVGLLGHDAIHSVVNPRSDHLSAAIHVYGGDFVHLPRSNWIGNPPTQQPASIEVSQAIFEAANRVP